MPKHKNQEQQAKKFLEETYDTLYQLFSQYARRAYEEQRHGPKPKNDRTGDWHGIYNTDSLEKDEEKFKNFKRSILEDDKFLNQYSNNKDDDSLLISEKTINKVKAARQLFIAAARTTPFTKKIDELNNLLNSPAIKDKLNEQKTTFGKSSNALKNFFNLRWEHINETAGANTARKIQERLTPFHQDSIKTQSNNQNDISLDVN